MQSSSKVPSRHVMMGVAVIITKLLSRSPKKLLKATHQRGYVQHGSGRRFGYMKWIKIQYPALRNLRRRY
jgi:hypothetical protein